MMDTTDEVGRYSSHGDTIVKYTNHELLGQSASRETAVACTAFGAGAAWYFLAMANFDINDGYSLNYDITGSKFYLAIGDLSKRLYAVCPKDDQKFMIAMERYDESHINTIDATKTLPLWESYIKEIIKATPIVAPSRLTLGVGNLIGATRKVELRAMFYPYTQGEAEPRAIKNYQLPPNSPASEIVPTDVELLDGILETLATFINPIGTPVAATKQEIRRDVKKFELLVSTYMGLRINGRDPLGRSGLSSATLKNNRFPSLQDNLSEATHRRTLDELMRGIETEHRSLMTQSLRVWNSDSAAKVERYCGRIIQTLGVLRNYYENGDGADTSQFDVLSYDKDQTLVKVEVSTFLENIKSAAALYSPPGSENVLSPLSVLASSLENSPIMRIAGKTINGGFKHVPFAIVFSVNQAATSCLFKDGWKSSPYIYFDSHGQRAKLVEFKTLHGLNELGYETGVIINIFILDAHLKVIKTVGADYYNHHFGDVARGITMHRFGDDLYSSKR